MTTHVFIVDSNTFPIHLRYMFAGTGFKENDINLNNFEQIELHHIIEKTLIGLLSDIKRVRAGDKVIFYLMQTSKNEGKFFGIFKIKNHEPLVFHECGGNYLNEYLKKELIFRTLLEPVEVYPNGVTEWEALDNIAQIENPKDLIWSLIYRKLKANRGCTPITEEESDKLIQLIKEKNNHQHIDIPNNLTFDNNLQKIVINTEEIVTYDGSKTEEELDIFPLMKLRCGVGRSHEVHLQSYITENAGKNNISLNQITGLNNEIIWLGNEVSCGVGMQRVDIFSIVFINNQKEFRVIELKCVYATPDITRQLKRYIDWTRLFINDANIEKIQPMIISLKIPSYSRSLKRKYETEEQTTYSDFFLSLINNLNQFNLENNCKPIRFFEYKINEDEIIFEEFDYDAR
ncbi:MAG: DUF91 domain-containing protein [Nanoarchaeota archaeon]